MNATQIWQGLGLVGVLGVGFFLGCIWLIVFLLITGTKSWHAKHHTAKNVYRTMCDHCFRERYGR